MNLITVALGVDRHFVEGSNSYCSPSNMGSLCFLGVVAEIKGRFRYMQRKEKSDSHERRVRSHRRRHPGGSINPPDDEVNGRKEK